MLETRYYKDLNHNYFILKCQEEQTGDRYQLKMITENKIPGLLNCSTRFINGDTCLYYEIHSLQTLQSLFEHRTVNRRQAIRILSGLKRVLQEIQNFLLLDSGLLLMPEYLFANWDVEEVYFVYYPYEMSWKENKLQTLLEFLVDVIDHQDELVVDTIYGLYQLAEREVFVIEELNCCLEELSGAQEQKGEEGQESSNRQQKIQGFRQPEEGSATLCQNGLSDFPMGFPFGAETQEEEEKPILVPPMGKKQEKKLILTALVSAVGGLGVLYIQQRYLLISQETVILWSLLFAFLFLFLITSVLYILLKCSTCLEKRPGQNRYQNSQKEEESYPASVEEEAAVETWGDTVFLFSTEETKENKLYGTSKGNKYHIDLNKLPCIVGKIPECSDCCIMESSISRLHVKFTGKENAIYMTDMNSTNGTYKNGLRLQPSETVQIEAGDEIRLGKLIFCYR